MRSFLESTRGRTPLTTIGLKFGGCSNMPPAYGHDRRSVLPQARNPPQRASQVLFGKCDDSAFR